MTEPEPELANIRRNMELHAIVFAEAPWNRGKPEDLKPEGATVAEAIEYWLACRADILSHGSIKQMRYCLTTDDVRRLSEYLEAWMASPAYAYQKDATA